MTDLKHIFDTFTDSFLENHSISQEQASVLNLLSKCRTSALGAHANTCDNCGHLSIAYNSCRNRHCPLCQSIKREMWRYDRGADLLNTHYFHVVFTVPHELNHLFITNKHLMYDLLMKSAAEALMTLAKSEKFLGAQIGATAILHTWGQTLAYHPHVHFIVPGGGLSLKSGLWKSAHRKFFLPVKVLSTIFRAIFLKKVKLLLEEEQLCYNPQSLNDLISSLYHSDFITFVKDNIDSPIHVINYLCQYTHRVAIANHRILKVDETSVSFKYKDYSNGGKTRVMTLSGIEFIRRFLLHVLPKGFAKIRHYGILAGRNRPTKLKFCHSLMKIRTGPKSSDFSTKQFIERFLPQIIKPCPACAQKSVPLNPT